MNVSKEVKILSLAFLIIFFGYNGIQQFLTTYFSEAGLFKLGFYCLFLVYLFFILANPLAALLVSKYGPKKCLLFPSLFYSIFILSLLQKSVILIYIASVLLGITGSLLWTAQNTYLIRASNERTYGENAGFFSVWLYLGSALGIIILGFLIAKFLYQTPFLIFSLFPLFGSLLLLKLKDLEPVKKINHFHLLRKSLISKTALRFSSIWFGLNFIFGLVIGIVPIQVKESLGVSFVGVLSFLFFISPIFFSYFFGKLSDAIDRKKMLSIAYSLFLFGLLCLLLGRDIWLVLGVILLAVNWAITRPLILSLLGDVSTKENLEFLTALFLAVQSIGVVLALLISSQFSIKSIYLISIAVTIVSFLIILPLLKLDLKEIKEKIAQEVN